MFLVLVISLVTSYHVEAEKEAEAALETFYSEDHPVDHARTLLTDVLTLAKNFITGLSQLSPILLGLIILGAVIGFTPILIFFSILITFNYSVFQWYLYQSGFIELNPNYFWHLISIYLYSITVLFV